MVGVEPESAATLTAALAAGEPARIEPASIADGLNAPFTGEHTLGVVRERVDEIVLVSEEEIAEGMRFLYGRAKLACEPAAPRRPARCSPARSRSSPARRSSPSCREATRTRRSLLLSSPRPDED